MASKEAVALATKILATVQMTSAVGTAGGSYMQESHQSRVIQNSGTAIEFLASQLDASAALIQETAGKGPPSKSRLAMILVQKGLAVGDFNDRTQCGAALASVGISIALTVGSVPTGPGGWLLAGASLLSDLYAAEVDCGSPVRNGAASASNAFDEFTNSLGRFVAQMEREIINLYMPGGGF